MRKVFAVVLFLVGICLILEGGYLLILSFQSEFVDDRSTKAFSEVMNMLAGGAVVVGAVLALLAKWCWPARIAHPTGGRDKH